MAIAKATGVALWSREGMELQATLSHPAVREPVNALHFLACGAYLVSVSTSSLVVWNLSAQAVWWWYDRGAAMVSPHPSRPEFGLAVAAPDALHLLHCEAASPRPLAAWRRPAGSVPWLAFGGGGGGDAAGDAAEPRLLVLGGGGRFVPLAWEAAPGPQADGGHALSAAAEESEPAAGLARIYGAAQPHRRPAAAGEAARARGRADAYEDLSSSDRSALARRLVGGQTHTLAAPALLLPDFIRSLAPRRAAKAPPPPHGEAAAREALTTAAGGTVSSLSVSSGASAAAAAACPPVPDGSWELPARYGSSASLAAALAAAEKHVRQEPAAQGKGRRTGAKPPPK